MLSDLKLYLLNIISFAISFSDVDMVLKFILLVVSIGYTIERWIKLRKDEPKGKDWFIIIQMGKQETNSICGGICWTFY